VVDARDLERVNLSEVPTLWRAVFAPESRQLLNVTAAVGPAMWYVEVPEHDATPPAMSLVAFDTTHFRPGTVVGNAVFEPLAIRSDQQVGAIRWWPGTGQIHQVYVQPHRRREGIGSALACAAAAHLVASGSPHRLWAGGDRTELGEALAQVSPHQHRVRPRQRVLPPMTPGADTTGIPDRNLYPRS